MLQNWLTRLEQQPRVQTNYFGLDIVRNVASDLRLIPVIKPVITVAGTNGKGSCVALCEAILRAQGYRVGSYFSPHLYCFNERIRINNQPVRDELICAAFEKIMRVSRNIKLSYFEFATLAALLIFQEANLDAYVLEVGIGGRLDTTNLVDTDIAVITSIDIDHREWLGDTRELIGSEKAGIFRSGRPAICGDSDMPSSIKAHADKIGATLYCSQKDYFFAVTSQNPTSSSQSMTNNELKNTWTWSNDHTRYNHLPLPNVLIQNAATAVATLQYFPLAVSRQAIEDGLKNVFLPGRLQIIDKPVRQIFDVAHNPAAAKVLVTRLQALACQGKTLAVVGMLKDKDISGTLAPLVPIVDVWYLTSLEGPRSVDAAVLDAQLHSVAHARQVKVEALLFDNVKNAFAAALGSADADDQVVVFGSFHTVGELCPVNS